MTLVLEQLLNGLQLGVMLFLLAAGLTLVFGIMGVINLAHGSLYMVGAYAAALAAKQLGPTKTLTKKHEKRAHCRKKTSSARASSRTACRPRTT